MFSYLDIYNTAGRFLKKITNPYRSNMDYKDDLYAFFIFCYHLEDHLKEHLNSVRVNSIPVKAHDVENYVTKNRELCICGNLCIITKHGNNSNYQKVRKKFGGEYGLGALDMGIKEHISISVSAKSALTSVDDLNEEKEQQLHEFFHQNELQRNSVPHKVASSSVTIDQHYFVVDSTGNYYDALDLAEKCFDLWTTFLKDNSLLNDVLEGSR